MDLVPALRKTANQTVRPPVLADRSEVRKPARQVLRQVLRPLLIAPNDVPLGIGEIRILEWSFAVRSVDGITWLAGSSVSRRRGQRNCRRHDCAFQPKNRDK